MTVAIATSIEDSIIHVRVTDKLTHEDYAQWVPAVDAEIEVNGRARILFEMHEFHGWTAGALWDDLKFGMKHFASIERMAMVGEKPWQKGMAVFCRPFTKARIRYFEADELEPAREWLRQGRGHAAHPEFDIASMPEPVAGLVRTLDGADGVARQTARTKLVAMGPEISHHLIAAAKGGNKQLRLEATQALAAIADPDTVDALAAQFDDNLEIGWAAAEGLKKLGKKGALAALHQLIQHPDSHGARTAAHHTLRSMEDAQVRATVAPVATSLMDSEPVAAASVAANAAIEALRAQ